MGTTDKVIDIVSNSSQCWYGHYIAVLLDSGACLLFRNGVYYKTLDDIEKIYCDYLKVLVVWANGDTQGFGDSVRGKWVVDSNKKVSDVQMLEDLRLVRYIDHTYDLKDMVNQNTTFSNGYFTNKTVSYRSIFAGRINESDFGDNCPKPYWTNLSFIQYVTYDGLHIHTERAIVDNIETCWKWPIINDPIKNMVKHPSNDHWAYILTESATLYLIKRKNNFEFFQPKLQKHNVVSIKGYGTLMISSSGEVLPMADLLF